MNEFSCWCSAVHEFTFMCHCCYPPPFLPLCPCLQSALPTQSLPTPEVVPFRLTRDIVDGMGPLGTAGIFSRSAEETARTLRENAGALLTILSAVVSDPLYEWKKSAARARVRQRKEAEHGGRDDNERGINNNNNPNIAYDDQDDEGREEQDDDDDDDQNDAATRAITKIHEKLQGYEDGTSSERQSVEGQVQLLINSARDPDNLAVLFAGWSPWL